MITLKKPLWEWSLVMADTLSWGWGSWWKSIWRWMELNTILDENLMDAAKHLGRDLFYLFFQSSRTKGMQPELQWSRSESNIFICWHKKCAFTGLLRPIWLSLKKKKTQATFSCFQLNKVSKDLPGRPYSEIAFPETFNSGVWIEMPYFSNYLLFSYPLFCVDLSNTIPAKYIEVCCCKKKKQSSRVMNIVARLWVASIIIHLMHSSYNLLG